MKVKVVWWWMMDDWRTHSKYRVHPLRNGWTKNKHIKWSTVQKWRVLFWNWPRPDQVVLPPSGYLWFHYLVHYIQIMVKVGLGWLLLLLQVPEADVFLSEARIKVFKKTGSLMVIEELNKVYTIIFFTVKKIPVSVDCSSFIKRLLLWKSCGMPDRDSSKLG